MTAGKQLTWQKVKGYTRLVGMAVAAALLLGVVTVSAPELPAGELAKQIHWLSQAGFIAAACMLFSWALGRGNYRWKHPDLYYIVVWTLILLGGWEAFLGLRQLYGFSSSHHSLYALTGSFFNPGPYSGYLAVAFPVCLNECLNLKGRKSGVETIGFYLSVLVLLLIICVLPAGMSRSAWTAVIVSGVWVYGMHYEWAAKLRMRWIKQRASVLGVSSVILICLVLLGASLFYLKKDSAHGRLFMWKISCQAIAERPFIGYGTDHFAHAYGEAQETYFAKGNYTSQEELVAGSPEYAFNEYLQIAVEWGIPALIGIFILIGFALWWGTRKGRLGVCGGIISLMVFAFSSYPMQIPVFIVTFACLLAACVVGRSRVWSLLIACMLVLNAGHLRREDVYEACVDWSSAKMLYQSGAYESAVKEYEKLYPALGQRGPFLFEYGHCLNKLKQYDASIVLLKEAMNRSCDPMIQNIIGKNYQQKGEYAEAEKWLVRSTHLLPGRIYPYYLLAKLYAEPDFYHPDELRKVAEIVMTKEPKVQSTAVKEMRKEVAEIMKNKHIYTNKETEN